MRGVAFFCFKVKSPKSKVKSIRNSEDMHAVAALATRAAGRGVQSTHFIGRLNCATLVCRRARKYRAGDLRFCKAMMRERIRHP